MSFDASIQQAAVVVRFDPRERAAQRSYSRESMLSSLDSFRRGIGD